MVPNDYLQWNLSNVDTIGGGGGEKLSIKERVDHVLWSGVYYTLCGLYLEVSKFIEG